MFINNKLDRLIQPDKLLKNKWETLEEELQKCVYDGTQYRADIASILTTRLSNYIRKYFGEKGSSSDVVTNRILEFVNSKTQYLSEDLLFMAIKSLVHEFPQRTNKLIANPKVMKKVLA